MPIGGSPPPDPRTRDLEVGSLIRSRRPKSLLATLVFVLFAAPPRPEEYERRHRPIWEELEAALVAHGVGTAVEFAELFAQLLLQS